MFWIVQAMIVSFVIIYVLHNLYIFFKETLTVPKMKDLVKRPQQKYETLFRELRNVQNQESDSMHMHMHNSGNNSNDPSNDAMKNELKRYLMELNAPEPEPQQQQSKTSSNFIELGSAYQ